MMRILPIVWQRLVRDGETCDRCGGTQAELQQALMTLTPRLRPLGIELRLETKAIDEAAFKASPLDSNRVWIAGRPLEEWLGATTGRSRCCAACGDSDCRTVELSGSAFETIPEALIVRAVLIAAGVAEPLPEMAPAAVGRPTGAHP
jgi:Domain of unknown function (DUF2703)